MELHFKNNYSKNKHSNFNFDIALKLPALGTLGVYGPSGAGKSTLLNMIAGLSQPDSGFLSFDGKVLFDSECKINVPVHKRRIGIVFQDSRLFPHLNVEQNLRYGYRLLSPGEQHISFAQVVELLELTPLLPQKPNQLSGGEKQRVALGRALLTSPRLLLLDEPLASLDTRLKQQILPFLRRVKNEINIPMIYVSHAIDEILYLTPHIAMIDRGRLLASGPFSDVIHQAPALALAQTMGLENILHTTITAHSSEEGYSLAAIQHQKLHIPLVQAEIGTIVSVSIAAANIALSTQKIQGITIQNQLAGTVQSIQVVSHKTLVIIQIADTSTEIIAEVTAKSINDLQLKPGSTIYCLIKTQSIHPLSTLV